MICPVCDRELKGITAQGLTVDVCKGGCGGTWFDQHELAKVDEVHEPVGEQLLSVARDESVQVDHTQRRGCPKCDGTVMLRHFFGIKHEVEVDECPRCAGFWLDHGELAKIRSQFDSPEEREQAEQAWSRNTCGKMLPDGDDKKRTGQEASDTIASLLMFRIW
jgi:uncharacterized protein